MVRKMLEKNILKMGTFNPKPYKKFNRETGKWELVIPEPKEYKSEERSKRNILKVNEKDKAI